MQIGRSEISNKIIKILRKRRRLFITIILIDFIYICTKSTENVKRNASIFRLITAKITFLFINSLHNKNVNSNFFPNILSRRRVYVTYDAKDTANEIDESETNIFRLFSSRTGRTLLTTVVSSPCRNKTR